MQKIKNLFRSSESRNGSYSVGITALVIAIIVIVNLIAGQIPEKYKNLDVSSTKIYEISKTSKKLLKNMDHKVKFTVLANKEEADERIVTFLSKYSALSSKISVEWIDPVLHPSALTENDASENSIVVSCQETGKKKVVSFSDIIVTDMSSYYYTGSASETKFDGEGQLSSAVNYVTSDVVRKIYQTSGHGETTLSSTIQDLMDKNNYTLSELNLLMNPEIPEDCDLLLMYAPAKDLTEEEKTAVETYLSGGGNVMILLGDTNATELPNLSALMKTYGLEAADGYIADPQRAYQGNYYYFFPMLSASGDLANGLTSEMVLLANAHGLNLTAAARDTITTEAFMETSQNAFAVTEESQSEGSYTLGATATEALDDEKESRLTVISAGSLIDAQITDTFTTLENTTLFMNVVTANFDDVENVSVEPKSLAVEYNTVQYPGILSLFVIFGIPIMVLAAGFVVWFRRRRA